MHLHAGAELLHRPHLPPARDRGVPLAVRARRGANLPREPRGPDPGEERLVHGAGQLSAAAAAPASGPRFAAALVRQVRGRAPAALPQRLARTAVPQERLSAVPAPDEPRAGLGGLLPRHVRLATELPRVRMHPRDALDADRALRAGILLAHGPRGRARPES